MKRCASALVGLITCVFLGASPDAKADDVPEPILEVMHVTTVFWSTQTPKLGSIFNQDRLGRLYSQDFVRRYRAAMKHPIYENGDTPFDFDVIVQGQDSCTPEDIRTHLYKAVGSIREYEVSFVRLGCFDGGDPKERTTIFFDIVTEAGREVIDDIATYQDNGKKDSTKVLMSNIAQGQSDRLYEPPR